MEELGVGFEGFKLLSGQKGPPEEEQGAQPSGPSWRGPFWRIWAAGRPKRTTRGRARSTAKLTKLARSVLEDLGCWAAKTDHQRESKEHSQADQAGEVRFGRFGLLSGQNGPPGREQGAQPRRPSWRGPFWEIWAAQRTKRTTSGRARSTGNLTKLARSLSGSNGPPEGEEGAQRSVLKDLGCWAAKTDHQRESKEHSQPDQAGEVRFGGFGLLRGQNGPPEGEQGAQPSWRGPFWRIWVAERPKRTTRERKGQRPTARPALVWWGCRACVCRGTWTL